MPDQNCRIIVVGSLGELVKKINETDLRLTEDPHNRALISETAAMQRLYREWPVISREVLLSIAMEMKYTILRYRAEEKELEAMLDELDCRDHGTEADLVWLRKAVRDLFQKRDTIKKQISGINKLCMGVGKADDVPAEAELEFSVL